MSDGHSPASPASLRRARCASKETNGGRRAWPPDWTCATVGRTAGKAPSTRTADLAANAEGIGCIGRSRRPVRSPPATSCSRHVAGASPTAFRASHPPSHDLPAPARPGHREEDGPTGAVRVLGGPSRRSVGVVAGQTVSTVNAYERLVSCQKNGGGSRMWVWILGGMALTLFVGFAWVTK